MTKSTLRCFKNSPYASSKHSTYFTVYDELFSEYVGKEITFVEIGVLHGGSLFMWRDYFGPQARIIGIEINKGAKKWEEYGFEIFIGEQEDPNFWNNFYAEVGKIDILLDDGGHFFDQQIITLDESLDHVNDGGIIVVEDTHTSHLKEYNGPRFASFLNYASNIAQSLTQRFHQINKPHWQSRNIASVSFYDSITAFRINKKIASQESFFIQNNGEKMNDTYFGAHVSSSKDKNYGIFRATASNLIKEIKYQIKKRRVPSSLKKYFSDFKF